MPCCCVLHCSNRSEKGFRLFHLPKGKANEDRRNLWVQNIGRTCLPNNPFVCEIHFTEDQFERNRADGRILLKWNAVPTLFINRALPLKIAKRRSKGTGTISPNETEEDDNDLEELQETTEAIASETDDLESEPKKLDIIQEETFTTNDNPEEESVQGTETRSKKTVCVKRKQKSKPKKIKKMPEDTVSADDDVAATNEETSEDDEEKRELKNRLMVAENKIDELGSHLFVYQNILEHLFNSDQIAYLMSEPVKGFKWSDETINNALILYESCGRIGYEELRKHNFPFPCAHTLEAILNKLQIQS